MRSSKVQSFIITIVCLDNLISETGQNFSILIGNGWSVRITSISMPDYFVFRLHSVPLMLLSWYRSKMISIRDLSLDNCINVHHKGLNESRKVCFIGWDFACVSREVNNHHPVVESSWKRFWTPSFKQFLQLCCKV